MTSTRLTPRRRAVALAALLAVAVLAGGAGIAAGSGDPKGDQTAAGTPADKQAQVGKPQAPGPGVAPGLLAQTSDALNGLVADGVIDQHQADGIQSRVASGRIDVDEVLSSGLLNEAQMAQVNDKLIAIKLAYAGS